MFFLEEVEEREMSLFLARAETKKLSFSLRERLSRSENQLSALIFSRDKVPNTDREEEQGVLLVKNEESPHSILCYSIEFVPPLAL